MVHGGQQERRRLARSGLRLSRDVLALKRQRKRSCLNRRAALEAQFRESTQQRRR